MIRLLLTRHFKILEKEGLVERHRNPENQREVLAEATKYAKEQLVVNPSSEAYQG